MKTKTNVAAGKIVCETATGGTYYLYGEDAVCVPIR